MLRPVMNLLRLAAAALVCAATAAPVAAVQMHYSGSVTTDVQLNRQKWHSADVTFDFVGDTNDLEHFDVTSNSFLPGCGSADLYCALRKGVARVKISAGANTVVRVFKPGQVAVAFDFNNNGIGFGSFIGPRGFEPAYPFGLDSGTTDSSFIGIADPTATINQTGKVYSCIGFAPGDYSCSDPTQYPLVTTVGEHFAIFMPYHTQNPDGTIGYHYGDGSLAVGTFTMAPVPVAN